MPRKLTFQQQVAHNIARVRHEQHLTQERLADLLGTSPRRIAAYESTTKPANLTLKSIEKIADALGVPPTDLVADPRVVDHTREELAELGIDLLKNFLAGLRRGRRGERSG